MDNNVKNYDLTRKWVDGGRDAIGKYRIGLADNSITVDFALEAKRNALNNAIKIDSTSRLISKLRYRQFGVLVTTSFLHHQAYQEIIDDEHPVIIICANDILKILKHNGIKNKNMLLVWLNQCNFKDAKRI